MVVMKGVLIAAKAAAEETLTRIEADTSTALFVQFEAPELPGLETYPAEQLRTGPIRPLGP